jgi:hypothetical protein
MMATPLQVGGAVIGKGPNALPAQDKMAFGRDGETERVRESIQSGRREIGWMDDGSQNTVGHSSAPKIFEENHPLSASTG